MSISRRATREMTRYINAKEIPQRCNRNSFNIRPANGYGRVVHTVDEGIVGIRTLPTPFVMDWKYLPWYAGVGTVDYE